MKGLILLLVLVALVGMLIVVRVRAQDTDEVTATVTVQYLTLSITGGEDSFNYGTMANNSSSSTLELFGGTGITVTNNGSLADFYIYGAHTGSGKGSGGWNLAGTAAEDEYVHKFCNETGDCSTPPGSYTTLTTSPGLLADDVANSGTVDFQLYINTPNPSTVYSQQSAVVIVQASDPS